MESTDFAKTLAQNVIAARTANQMTQQELAEAAGISRATVAEIERGGGDPRLSTLVGMAGALHTSPIMLFLERATLEVVDTLQRDTKNLNAPSAESVEKMVNFLKSESRTGSQQAAKEGIRALGAGGGAGVGAAIGSVLLPGVGTMVGAALGGLLGQWSADQTIEEARKQQNSSPHQKKPDK